MRVALVGCGAIAQITPAAPRRGLSLDALFDVYRARAVELRRALASDAMVCGDLDEVARHAEAAIVAVPNAHHADTTIALLSRGLHVLCEKPLALTVADGERMIAAAAERGRLLACGLVRRFFVSSDLCAEALARGLIGEVRRVEVRESVYNWPMSRSSIARCRAAARSSTSRRTSSICSRSGWARSRSSSIATTPRAAWRRPPWRGFARAPSSAA